MGRSRLLILAILLLPLALGQSCQNYGINNSSSCACPPGLGGETCSQPACGGNIFQGTNRTLVPTSSSFPNITSAGCTCETGWIGTGCNVCQTASACQNAYSAVGGNATAGAVANATESSQNNTMVCNTQPQVYAASQMSCQVVVCLFFLLTL